MKKWIDRDFATARSICSLRDGLMKLPEGQLCDEGNLGQKHDSSISSR